jgi:nicotinamidase/pyrazinamidase
MIALLLVDIQNDFTPATADKPDGALAVPGGNEVIAVANRLMPEYELVVATQDWHPAGHKSFASQHPGRSVGDVITLGGLDQVLWPDHCVQGTPGAELCAGLDRQRIDEVVRKGTDPDIDSYSGFFDNDHKRATGLADLLRRRGIGEVHVMGLATDYCVQFTALDAVELGFKTTVIVEGCRAVNLEPGDDERAIEAMHRAGVRVIGHASSR